MEYWEFLLQKEGERSWLPLKLPRIEIEEGRYRVVAHSSRTSTEVEINVTYDSTEEVPPKRRHQKRSRRTNLEGLMVVIPFTYLKRGLWELRCGGDIMSDFLGNSWQHAVELQVIPKVTDVELTAELISSVVDAPQTPVQANFSKNLPSSSDSERAVAAELLKMEASSITPQRVASNLERAVAAELLKMEASSITPQRAASNPKRTVAAELLNIKASPVTPQRAKLAVPEPEILVKSQTNVDQPESVSATLENTVVSLEPASSDENKSELTANSAEEASSTNPILDKSLQMLEQILQQVLEPVLQDFERAQSPEPKIEAELEESVETDTNQQGFILTLDEDALVARQGESLTIAGKVDVLDVNQFNGSRTSRDLNSVFHGALRYELRDPQTLGVLLDVQQPLSEQSLPLAFSHTLEIPSECNTRLLLGKVTLCGSTSVALASQPFSVTADLDKLLEAIIPGTQVMPVAKVLVLANNPTAFPENGLESPESVSPPLDRALLDLVNTPESRQPAPLKPASPQPLPPKIYQTSPTQRSSKSLHLPDFPRLKPVATNAESSASPSTSDTVEVKLQDSGTPSLPIALAGDLLPGTSNSLPVDTAENTASEVQLQEAEQQSEDSTLEGVQLKPVDNVQTISRRPGVPTSGRPSQPTTDDHTPSEGDSVPVEDSSSSAKDVTELSDAPVQIVDSLSAPSDTLKMPAPSQSTADSTLDIVPNGRHPAMLQAHRTSSSESADFQIGDSDAAEFWEVPEPDDISSGEVLVAESVVDEHVDVDNAFQALKIQDRFWWRLNSMAGDAQLSESLKSELSPSGKPATVKNPNRVTLDVEEGKQQLNSEQLLVDFDESMWEEETDDFDSAIAQSPLPFAKRLRKEKAIADSAELQSSPLIMSASPEGEMPDQPSLVDVATIDWTAQEIVVEDEELELPAPAQSEVTDQASSKIYPVAPPNSQPKPVMLQSRSHELPLPAPALFLPTNELAAGETVTLRVKLPPHPARLCVKLWVQDRQSRSLLDGPRWLVDLIPDGAGQLEAMTQLSLPFGSVEIRFEAIAIDLDSQRESNKVAVDCVVLPPDFPSLSLDEF